jgi:hypothetical protein
MVPVQYGLRGEVEGFPVFYPALAAGQGEQPVDEAFLLLVPLQCLLAPGGRGAGDVPGQAVSAGSRESAPGDEPEHDEHAR